MKIIKRMRIGLQFFADAEGVDTTEAEATSTDDGVEQTETTENVTSDESQNVEKKQVEKTFSQAELDEIINKRMAREKGASSFLEKLAQRQNMSVNEFMKSVEEAISNQEITNYSKEKGVSNEIAKEMFSMKQKLSDMEAQNKRFEKEKAIQQEWKELKEEFPDVAPENIPKEVLEMTSKGTKLVDAYSRYAYKQLKESQDKIKQDAIKDYLAGKLKADPVEGAGSTVVVAPESHPKTFEEARKQAISYLQNSKEFKV